MLALTRMVIVDIRMFSVRNRMDRFIRDRVLSKATRGTITLTRKTRPKETKSTTGSR